MLAIGATTVHSFLVAAPSLRAPVKTINHVMAMDLDESRLAAVFHTVDKDHSVRCRSK